MNICRRLRKKKKIGKRIRRIGKGTIVSRSNKVPIVNWETNHRDRERVRE